MTREPVAITQVYGAGAYFPITASERGPSRRVRMSPAATGGTARDQDHVPKHVSKRPRAPDVVSNSGNVTQPKSPYPWAFLFYANHGDRLITCQTLVRIQAGAWGLAWKSPLSAQGRDGRLVLGDAFRGETTPGDHAEFALL